MVYLPNARLWRIFLNKVLGKVVWLGLVLREMLQNS